MRRAAIEKLRTLSVWRRHLAEHARPVLCKCDTQVGRFRKGQRVGGCSTPRCFLCHSAKFSREVTLRLRRANASFHEGLAELSRPNPAVNADAPRRDFARLSRAGYLSR